MSLRTNEEKMETTSEKLGLLPETEETRKAKRTKAVFGRRQDIEGAGYQEKRSDRSYSGVGRPLAYYLVPYIPSSPLTLPPF